MDILQKLFLCERAGAFKVKQDIFQDKWKIGIEYYFLHVSHTHLILPLVVTFTRTVMTETILSEDPCVGVIVSRNLKTLMMIVCCR